MALQLVTLDDYDIIPLSGTVTISTLSTISPELNRHVQSNGGRHVVLDLSLTQHIDSSVIKLLLNLKKRLEEKNREFGILAPAGAVVDLLKITNLDKTLRVVPDLQSFERHLATREAQKLAPFTTGAEGTRRVRMSCPVCGSQEVVGYLVDRSKYAWRWNGDAAFPVASDAVTGQDVDYFSLLPVICGDCYLCATDMRQFVFTADTERRFPTFVDEPLRVLLAKGVHKRKSLMQTAGVVIGDNFFLYPRNQRAGYLLYLLAENTARTIAMKDPAFCFQTGFLNYLTINYAFTEQKPMLIDNCRTWLTRAVAAPESLTHLQLAQAYFVLMIANLNVEKKKEAMQMFNACRKLAASLPQHLTLSGVRNPQFWASQCDRIWTAQAEVPAGAK